MIYRYLLSLGYNEEEINKISNVCRKLKVEDIYKIVNDKIDYLINLGFSMEDIINITVKYPNIFLKDREIIDEMIDCFLKNGYIMEEILIILKKNPIIFSKGNECFFKKVKFYNLIGIGKVFFNDSRSLIQGIDLTYARYMFYRRLGIKINENNYYMLFVEERKFLSKYGKNNKTLMVIYNFDEFLNKNVKCKKKIK